MAKKSAVARNGKRERLAAKYKRRRQMLKELVHDRDLTPEERFQAAMNLNKIPKNACPVRVHSRCGLTGRSRGVYRKFKLSRIALRELASRGLIPGMTKASW